MEEDTPVPAEDECDHARRVVLSVSWDVGEGLLRRVHKETQFLTWLALELPSAVP